ncbi:hypothetical protein ADH75_13540 [Flavonifractor plautii]|nr:hypothetical protein A4U99_04975 [Flavonifractor plautii]OXE44600.1 hypothetical protein ADH75_13540 [Flavonifractor plautii]
MFLWLWLALEAAAVRVESAVEEAAEVGPQRSSMFWIAIAFKTIVLLLVLVALVQSLLLELAT